MKCIGIFLLILIANSSTDISCKSDSDCENLNTCENHKCIHKSLIPLVWIEYIGSMLMIFVSSIANAGGTGGSSVIISIMITLFQFDAHASVSNAQVFMFAGTLTVTSLKIRERHPTKDRPLICYDVLMPIIGPLILGVSIGVMINPMFPEWLLLGLLSLLVIFLLWNIITTAKKIYNKERPLNKIYTEEALLEDDHEKDWRCNKTSALLEALSENSIFIDPKQLSFNSAKPFKNTSKLQSGYQGLNDSEFNINLEEIEDEVNINKSNSQENKYWAKVQSIYQEEKKIISWIPLTYFMLLVAISIGFAVLRARKLSGIKSCTLPYFSLTIGYIGLMFLLMFFVSAYLVRKTSICEKGEYLFDEGDIHWTYHKCAKVCIFGVFTGLIVGLLGMGGGNIIGPLLLNLGVRPEISTVSSSFCIFISTGIAASQYLILGEINAYYALWFFGISIIGSMIGILFLRRFAVKRNRVSLLVICIGVILLLSLITIPTIGIINAVHQNDQGNFQLGFSSLC